MSTFDRKPRAELRHWSTYRSVGAWFDDHRGHVPIQMATGLGRLMQANPEMTFPEAYAHLLHEGAIIHVDPADDALPRDPGAAR